MDNETMVAVAVGSAAVSVLALIANVIYSIYSIKTHKTENSIAIGEAETSLRNAIVNARNRHEDITEQIELLVDGRSPEELDERDKRKLLAARKRMLAASEQVLNSYEQACSRYLDSKKVHSIKIDRERFKKDYLSEVRNIVTSNEYRDFLHPEGTSRYQALWRVYREWHILETG